jgi:predicted metalloprotease with PDZ domain
MKTVDKFKIFRTLGISLSIAIFFANAARSQSPLDRLENQIRSRAGQESQPTPPPPGIASNPPTANDEAPGYLGLVADDKQDRGRGVRVLNVVPNGPADKAGIKKQDLITAVSGMRTRQLSEFSDLMSVYAAGESVEFEIVRDNKPLQLIVMLEVRPAQKSTGVKNIEAIPIPKGEKVAPDITIPEGKEPLLELLPPHPATANSPVTVKQLQKRIEELERRVTELEKKLAAKP